jgi:hypothetical protein
MVPEIEGLLLGEWTGGGSLLQLPSRHEIGGHFHGKEHLPVRVERHVALIEKVIDVRRKHQTIIPVQSLKVI